MGNNYKVTFLNDNADKNLKEIGIASLESLKEDLEKFMEAESETGYYEVEDLGSLYEYGISFEGVRDDDIPGWIAFFRWQLSWGGPSTEVRFYPGGKTEFVYLDWFCGVGFDVSDDETFRWIRGFFKEMMMDEIYGDHEIYY